MAKRNDEPVTPEQFFGLVEIKDECSANGCNQAAVAGSPIRTPQETGVWWFCAEHAGKVSATGLQPQEIVRSCRAGNDTPCGAVAAYVAIVGFRDEAGSAQLSLVSVCGRHADGHVKRFRSTD